MELDTGASVSFMSEAAFNILKEQGATLSAMNARLCMYTGDAIGVLGSTKVHVQYESQSVTLLSV